MRVERLDLLTDGSGAMTGYLPYVAGLLHALVYVPGSSALDSGAGIAVTEEATGRPIVTVSSLGSSLRAIAPREPTHAVADGADAVYAADGEAVLDRIAVAGRLKVVVSSGGAAKTGTLYAYVA